MAISSYATLQTELGNWLNRADLTGQLPEFIQIAEARFNRVIRSPEMLVRNDSFTVDSQYETVPTGFLEARRFTLLTSPVRPLQYITPEQMAEWRVAHTSSAKPKWFTVAGGSFEFLPTPDSAYTASLLYYAGNLALATTDPNWLLTKHPDIYLYGSLVAAEPYVMNDERVGIWKAQLDEALSELATSEQNKALGATPRAIPRSFG